MKNSLGGWRWYTTGQKHIHGCLRLVSTYHRQQFFFSVSFSALQIDGLRRNDILCLPTAQANHLILPDTRTFMSQVVLDIETDTTGAWQACAAL